MNIEHIQSGGMACKVNVACTAFFAQVNSLVKSLERVESHAKGLTQNNIDLRLQLKQVQDEMHQWKFKFLKIENTKDSMVQPLLVLIS